MPKFLGAASARIIDRQNDGAHPLDNSFRFRPAASLKISKQPSPCKYLEVRMFGFV